MNDHDDFRILFRAPAGSLPDDGFTERVMQRIRYRARRRRAILAAATMLAIPAASAAAWMIPVGVLALDARSVVAILLLVAASGLITLGTETSSPARRVPVSRY